MTKTEIVRAFKNWRRDVSRNPRIFRKGTANPTDDYTSLRAYANHPKGPRASVRKVPGRK